MNNQIMCDCKDKEYELALIPELQQLFHRRKYSRHRMPDRQNFQYEYEAGPVPAPPKPKTIWAANTDLDAPYFGGNFNFLYNGGANEAIVTFNTLLSFRNSFPASQKSALINNLKAAADVWDNAAEIQIRDQSGNYSERIRLRFRINFVNDMKNANKKTDVHPDGTRSVWFLDKGRESVMRELNIFIGSSSDVLAHELGHVWGLLDEYKDRWISMKLSLGHVGPDSPLLNDKIAIMNEGYDAGGNSGEFRTRYFQHFGRAILNSFWNMPNFILPIVHNGKTISRAIYGRIALLKKNIHGDAPYNTDMPPFNPLFSNFQVAKL